MAGVMGWPVAHSRSPEIHNYWIRQYGLTGAYGRFPVAPDQLGQAIQGIRSLGLAGSNITIPHKVDAMQYMDWVHPLALKMGAINTIVRQPDGALHGFNNDGFGYIESLREAQPTWRANSGPVVVLGAGGASRAIVVSLIDAGATEIRLLNRSRDKADALAQEFGHPVSSYDWSERENALAGAALANAMYGKTLLPVSSVERAGTGLWVGEVVATFGLVLFILLLAKNHAHLIAAVVGVWIVAGHLFTSSTSFANPAVSFGRVFSEAPTSISPSSLVGFVAMQLLGALLAAVYALASLMQLVVGHLLDRFPIKQMYLTLIGLQMLMFALAVHATGWWFYVLQFAFMAVIFGAIPFTDAMIVRYVDDAQRSRVSGMRLAVALGASSLAVWLIGPIVKAAGFTTLIWVMVATSCLTFAVVSLLPHGAGEPVRAG